MLALRISAALTMAIVLLHWRVRVPCSANSSVTNSVAMNSLTLMGLVRYRKNPRSCRPYRHSRLRRYESPLVNRIDDIAIKNVLDQKLQGESTRLQWGRPWLWRGTA